MTEPRKDTVGDESVVVCLNCNSRRETESQAFRSATRKVALLTAICSVLCVLTISACCCSLYIYTRFQGFRQELVTLVQTDHDAADYVLANQFPKDHNAMPMYGEPLDDEEYEDQVSENTNRIRHRRRKGKKGKSKAEKPRGNKQKCRKKQKKTCDCCKQALSEYIDKKIETETTKIKKEVSSPTTQAPPIESDSSVEEDKNTYVSTAHYTTYIDEDFITAKFGKPNQNFQKVKPKMEIDDWGKSSDSDEEMSLDMPEWQAAPTTLRFFKEADWMENSTTVKIFDFDKETGKFKAKHTGLYHLYAHVLFYDEKTRMAIGIMHERKTGLQGGSNAVIRCTKSEDNAKAKLKAGHNSRLKSCNLNGALYLNEGDQIFLQSLYDHASLDLSKDASYFGGMFFSTPSTKKLS